MTQSIHESNARRSSQAEEARREAEQRAEVVDAEEQREHAQRAARDPERDTAAEREQMERDAWRREHEQHGDERAPQSFGTSFLAEGTTEAAWQRWRELQSNFVDDPQNSVKQAHGLVGELIDGIVFRFETEREQLEKRWSSGQEVSTEDLRCCLQRYRDFFGRLLANVGQAPAE